MNYKLWHKRIRNYAGLLGMLLPWVSLVGALIVNRITPLGDGFWNSLSISETYFVTPALTGILTTASIVLMCYDGYDLQDNLITTLSGVFGILIVLFPCDCPIAPDYIGFFRLPCKLSLKIHCVVAAIFFCLLAYNSIFLFTKHGSSVTKKKKVRNMIYRICGTGMIAGMIVMALPLDFSYKIWVCEMIMLSFFGISWLIKGGAVGWLNDKQD